MLRRLLVPVRPVRASAMLAATRRAQPAPAAAAAHTHVPQQQHPLSFFSSSAASPTSASPSSPPTAAAASTVDTVIAPQISVSQQIHGNFREAYGTGRRKTASARVWIRPGDGDISINNQSHVSYFVRPAHRDALMEPFVVTDTVGAWDVRATVRGGGLTGQAEAVRHGIALALRNAHPLRYTKRLREHGLTTRDPRMVERKKPGQPKARKKFQWVKR